MGLEEWNKAEMALQRILNREPQHDVALYQLSQVYLEQNRTRLALEVIRSASKNACSSAKKTSTVPIMPNLEIVMNELRKLKMSADFFANTSHDICRCPGV